MIQTYSLDRGGAPLYEQLYRALKADILSGRLTAGEKLPSKRALAAGSFRPAAPFPSISA